MATSTVVMKSVRVVLSLINRKKNELEGIAVKTNSFQNKNHETRKTFFVLSVLEKNWNEIN